MTVQIHDLPAELLDRVYDYLGRLDSECALTPKRDDLYSVSLTCKHLRHSILPLIFRSVILSLRWFDGELVEPRLVSLRRLRPDLTRHIRAVHIRTDFHAQQIDGHRPVLLPEDALWLNPEAIYFSDSAYHIDVLQNHRQRITEMLAELAVELYGDAATEVTTASASAEVTIREITSQTYRSKRKLQREIKLGRAARGVERTTFPSRQTSRGENDAAAEGDSAIDNMALARKADAVAVAMLCLPATVTALTFETRPDHAERARVEFSLYLATAAFKILGSGLEALSVIMTPNEFGRDRALETDSIIAAKTLASFTKLKQLTLATTSFAYDPTNFVSTPNRLGTMSHHYTRWHALSTSHLARIDLRNINTSNDDLQNLLEVAKAMPRLRSLNFHGIWVTMTRHGSSFQPVPNTPTPTQPNREPRAQELTWLNFAIALRRELPATRLSFAGIAINTSGALLVHWIPASALRWIMDEAVPVNANVDYEREQRLTEDFESFMCLWTAEDSDRGVNAAADRVKTGGMLADAAMSRRWRNATTVLRDEGEWITM